MNLFPCPACAEPAFSYGQKSLVRTAGQRAPPAWRARVGVAALPSVILLPLASLTLPFGFTGGFWLCQSAGSLVLSLAGGLAGAAVQPLPFAFGHTRLAPLVVRER
ncbi:hypothetical protein [Tahibacter caeni]|uniref:hypothetical protein n=1 Tax=Tahibacter caeni TaxID=1453545 RepID=UPI0021488EB1|nr:hypothetical protein [Tahibacter caeni]